MISTLEKRNAHLQNPLPLLIARRQPYPGMQNIPSRNHENHSRSFSKSPFSGFPPEIVRTIVEQAAAVCLQTTLALTLVSKTVRAWVEPTLYRSVILWTPHTVQLFRAAFDAKPTSFFATHVRNLFINDEGGTDIILACSGVQRLAAYPPALVDLPNSDDDHGDCSSHNGQSSSSTDSSCPTPVEVMLMGCLEDVSWASPLFHNVKYLYVGLEPPTPETACDLSLLPSLTHCAFPYDGDADDALLLTISILLESTTIERILVLVNDEEGNPDSERKGCIWVKLACMADRRLLVGTEASFDGDDWLSTVNEGTSFWDLCEEFRDWRHDLL